MPGVVFLAYSHFWCRQWCFFFLFAGFNWVCLGWAKGALIYLVYLFIFLGVQLRHMEVPRLEVKSEPQPHWIQALSATFVETHGNARSLTHWARPGIEPPSSWILVGFVTHWAIAGAPSLCFFMCSLLLIFFWTMWEQAAHMMLHYHHLLQ